MCIERLTIIILYLRIKNPPQPIFTCSNETLFSPTARNRAFCQCGGAREYHLGVTTGDCTVNKWDSFQHTTEYPTDAFGYLEFAGAGRRQKPVGISFFYPPLCTQL